MDSTGQTCLGHGRHSWRSSRIVAHVMDTAFTPVDERKLVHKEAFYLMCNYQQYCQKWFGNQCKYAHSQVEKAVWMLERDTKITREELVQQSASLFTAKQTMSAPPLRSGGGAQQSFWAHAPQSHTQQPQQTVTTTSVQGQAQTKSSAPVSTPSVLIKEFCRTCWGKGQKSEEDKGKDRCVRGHSNFKLNSAFVTVPAGKEIRSLPALPSGMKLILCEYFPKCTRRVCTHPHGQEELEVWGWMLRNNIKTLREVCDRCTEAQKQRNRNTSHGESMSGGSNVSAHTASAPAPSAVGASAAAKSKAVNQIIAPGDLHIHEHYCQYCGISCNSERQWDEHRMSERHITNVNSDKEHQWNYRQPPWGQGKNLDLCAKHLLNKSCQYSYVPDMYNLCRYAHSQEELDEWRERHEWRQMKRMHARDRNMSSYTEALLEEYHNHTMGSSVLAENIPDVRVICEEDQVLYRTEKNDIFTWTFQIHTKKTLDKVALLYNKDRLHFKLLSNTGGHHQVATGDTFLDVDKGGRACYKVNVHFNGGMFGSFSQWVVFDFGSRPVLIKKLSVEIGDQIQHERVKELRDELSIDRWTSLNREIVKYASEAKTDEFDEMLLHSYKEPSASEDVVTSHRLTDLNPHNYTHKMHGLLELEEITRQAIITRYNLFCEVTFSQTLQEPGMFLIGTNGDLFIKVSLTEFLTHDTLAGKLVLTSVRTALIARADSTSKQVYQAELVGENNYGYDGRGKEYVYLVVQNETASAMRVGPGMTVRIELQFQMDRLFFCRMHYALDSLQNTDVVFPDLVKFKPDINMLSSATRAKLEDLNEDQMSAVRHIVVPREGYTPPFIMYGPFGTGKTMTLAQAALTLLRERRDQCRILICTQSNSAADLYITKYFYNFLKKGGRNLRVLRLNATQRRMNTVPDQVREFCYTQPDSYDKFQIPPKYEIETYQLVLTTVETSLVLSKLNMHGHFTHIFVDEAGQTLECEILMPLSLADTRTCVVLAGDHHQIGPPVYSQETRRQNFGLSMLVRLYNYYDSMANCINQVSDTCKKSPVNIFLSMNYRTKEEILRFISSVFYGGPDSLKAEGKIPSVIGITPLMFYAVQGKEIQNLDSTSYLNHAEAQEVVARVTELYDNWPVQWGARDPSQIAVIATYADQVKHVRKMLRGDRKRPYLSQVDVGPIHSFQGKEVRALFITAVRTSNLLREPHIERSLEAGEDIGDLGFMSDPKLLNTALTRTQSFVAVVGDPVALCLIGECTQIWRTYLKHCSNMGSVRPMSYNYEAIKTKALQSYQGPDGRVIELIAKRGQESFKHALNISNKTSRLGQEGYGKTSESSVPQSGGDAGGYGLFSLSDGNAFSHAVNGSGDGGHVSQLQASWPPKRQHAVEQAVGVLAEMAASSEDILCQLARESLGEQASAVPIKSEGICIKVEKDWLAILTYNPDGSSLSNQPLQESFKICSEDEDFVAFFVHDKDTGMTESYENWGREKLWAQLENDPQRYVKCVLTVKRRDFAIATVLGAPHTHSGQPTGQDVEIHGSLNRGHALNGDTVVVELSAYKNEDALQGQVKGILERAQDPVGRLFVCTADPDKTGILTPINGSMPRIYAITGAVHVTLARKGYVCVYKLGSQSCIEFSNYEKVDPTQPLSQHPLFVVRYLCWQPGMMLPCGVVIGVIKQENSVMQGIKVLDIEHNIQHEMGPQALQEAENVFPDGSEVPAELLLNRQDLTQDFCFTVDDAEAGDLQLAVSIVQTGNMYEVGLHVTDVSAFVDKDSALDQECELRGSSLYPAGGSPRHMLPHYAASDLCSLVPGMNRLAISVVTSISEEGRPHGMPSIFRSVVNSRKHFTHAEVEDILLSPEEAETNYLKSCIIVLYQLAFLWRGERLGNGEFYSGLEPEMKPTQHSHLMMEEVKLKFDNIIANMLMGTFPETTPLLIQPLPPQQKLTKWKKENAAMAMHSIPMTKAFLDGKVCRCKKACTCVFSYIRQHRLENVEYLMMLKDSWLSIHHAVSEEFQDYELAHDVIASPEHMPHVWLAAQRLASIQPQEAYACSALLPPSDRQHYGLSLAACTNWTSPGRKFISLVIQRLLTAIIDRTASPYNSAEMGDICTAATVTERQIEAYHKDHILLHLGLALQARPIMLSAAVSCVESGSLHLSLGPGLRRLPECKVDLQLLGSSRIAHQTSQNGGVGGSVLLEWQERVYDYAGSENQAQYSSAVKLDADKLVCNIQGILWQRLLIAVREKDDASLVKYVKEISHQVGGELELRSTKSQTEVLSSQLQHFVPFSLSVSEGQCFSVQVSASRNYTEWGQGSSPLKVQLVQLTPCLAICLEHRHQPTSCFTSFTNTGTSLTQQMTYTDEVQYTREWLLPALALESAQQAVERGERVTIHNINITWTSATPSCVMGVFSLSKQFCEQSMFSPDAGSNLASTLLSGGPFYKEDANYCVDYLCVRYSGLAIPPVQQQNLVESVSSIYSTSPEPVTWVGHCRILDVTKLDQGFGDFEVKIALVQSSMDFPVELLGDVAATAPCTVEWISKTAEHRAIDIAARGLSQATPFVKDVLIGRKPLNTIDPVPQDNSVLEQSLDFEQEELTSECYRQPFLTVIGGPGTGKSLVAARLAHLLVSRNRTTDTFRQVQADGGPCSQLMICAPTEKSLDVITGYLQGLNIRNVQIVRVYSEEVEERDFPTPFVPKPSKGWRQPSCAVMEDVALHHLIRRGDSPEVQDLLEKEMLLTMYGDQVTTALTMCLERAQIHVLRKAQVILCTPINSMRPVLRTSTNIRQIILDDAGIIPEMEAIVPLVMHSNINQLIVFGDHKMPARQLSCQQAAQLGLSRSLLQRFSESAKTLTCQYRTNKGLVTFPSAYFYNRGLHTSLEGATMRAAAPSIPWPGSPGLPCVFCHVQGLESVREKDSTSIEYSDYDSSCVVNTLEVQAVVALVESLIVLHKVEESSILVLTATQSQASLMKDSFHFNVDVCSVSESIGRECDYVILSTVRSLPPAKFERPASAQWIKKHLGNMADPGMVNLAITRARTALFIIGNKDILSICEPWQSLLTVYRHYQCLQTDTRHFLQSMRASGAVGHL